MRVRHPSPHQPPRTSPGADPRGRQSSLPPRVRLLAGRRRIACKPSGARGAWYAAKFEDGAARRRAEELAKELGWSCWNRGLRLRSGGLSVSGPGRVNVVNGVLDVQGNVSLRLPADAVIEKTFDVDRFRRQVAVASGRLPVPPGSTATGMPVVQLDVPGLTYVPHFLSEAEERSIIEEIGRVDWSQELRRRVQHYGWRYDYRARHVDPTMRLGSLPAWAAVIARRLVDRGLVPRMADQLIVNEYVGNQGISAHVDSEPSFADGIAMWSACASRGKWSSGRNTGRASGATCSSGGARQSWREMRGTAGRTKYRAERMNRTGAKNPERRRESPAAAVFRSRFARWSNQASTTVDELWPFT